MGVYHTKRRRLEVYPSEGATVFPMQLTGVRSERTGAAASGAGAVVSGGLEGMDMRQRRVSGGLSPPSPSRRRHISHHHQRPAP